MKSATPVFLAVLLVTSLLAMPVIAIGATVDDAVREDPETALQQPTHHQLTLQDTFSQRSTPIEVEDTTNRLPLSGDVRSGHTDHGADLGTALASADDQLRVDHEQYTLIDSEFATASDDEQEAMVRAAYNRITDRTEELEERERTAVRDHADNELSDAELLQTLLRNQGEAAALEDALLRLTEERTDEIDGYALSYQQTRADETLLELHQTALRTSLEQTNSFGGADEVAKVRIETSENGYSLSTIDGDMYLRETVRFDHRDADGVNQFDDQSYSETMEHTADRYPWAGGEQGWAAFGDSSNENLYIMTMEVDQDQLKVYLDAGTGEVYHESQQLSLDSLPEDNNETWANNSLQLRLTETAAEGPAQVTVYDTVQSEPVSATVTVDGVEVGQTADDGTLWFIPPVDEYELSVEDESGSVDVTVD